MTVGDLIDELRDLDEELEVEVTVPLKDMDAELVLTDFTIIVQNGRFSIHTTG